MNISMHDKVSTGLTGFDQVIDKLRLGDNVVWQVDSVAHYRTMIEPFVAQAKLDRRKLIYVRFGSHEPLLEEDPGIRKVVLDAGKGFESFAAAVHSLIEEEGRRAFYVFDCLTGLLEYWYSDAMIGNFFNVSCPFLYELDTIAYFAIIRNTHTYATIAGIRETTQLLLDLYHVNGHMYIHPLKVWNRYSPSMFFPHLIQGQEAVSITSSVQAAELFSAIHRGEERLDYWDTTIGKAREALAQEPEQQEAAKQLLLSLLVGPASRMQELCERYFTLEDLLLLASREVGTGLIGGKSVGMLLARKIVEREGGEGLRDVLEPHDSYYIGADVFYTYMVQNGWWKLRARQRTQEGYFTLAPELQEKMKQGKFSESIRRRFVQLLEYFGQSPIIVRSSSLLEDNFGNAFAGKYESVFCVNQGTPEERYEAFEQAVRTVYASMMNEDALAYRMNRGLLEKDEQMALLVQRVSGDHYRDAFLPHIAGVGNSSNLYVWDSGVDMDAGMLRLVFGLGTRAVDRTVGDYVKIVALDNPLRPSPMDAEDIRKFSQHGVDVLSLTDNTVASLKADQLLAYDLKADKTLFATVDDETAGRLRELGYTDRPTPHIVDFQRLLKHTKFPQVMKEMLALLSRVYEYPVDIEFTANFTRDNRFKVNLLQCRPLQTKGLGQQVELPQLTDGDPCFFSSKGSFMGGNVRLPIDYVVFVRPQPYLERSEQGKYAVARQIGKINRALQGKQAMLIGPGRWGTTTPSLGVPVHFSELCYMTAICEVASEEAGFTPELSYGSHFFQDLVETGIFYAAIFDGRRDVRFHPEAVLERENRLAALLPGGERFADVIHVAETGGMELYADIVTQTLLCR
ncbi:Pyruvate phosphate dikinase, PEP/pyruvate binding domain [Paenibacillus sp. UNCCL117]|uniref:PEP/pyruvate-binding domain-containing protein n=1 Tax=unclassified Paenibacillus TaxID=185978 RepID=UPI000889234F|nr:MULTISPECIES: PEP/pyruvate-binding domain-containing protein [unclassified Paenibacillus]SDE29149.1 Pyruvate phosphate dikinase, PEP/pyruvate binding domain [Paenibacillus sp. cl123]SFW63329.1 Pyruvate phosphate dikinase, PEP/pyruvate binding domain [Paenibacillus sp. UNCCL117]